MADFTGLRSCTWTEFPALSAQNASSVTRSNTASSCDLTLLTCLLIGSYRFCILPLLAVFNGNDKKLWRSKWILELIHMLQQNLLWFWLKVEVYSVKNFENWFCICTRLNGHIIILSDFIKVGLQKKNKTVFGLFYLFDRLWWSWT